MNCPFCDHTTSHLGPITANYNCSDCQVSMYYQDDGSLKQIQFKLFNDNEVYHSVVINIPNKWAAIWFKSTGISNYKEHIKIQGEFSATPQTALALARRIDGLKAFL